MEFFVMSRTYNSYGGHQTLGLLPDLLIRQQDSFGRAIEQLTLTFHFPTSGPPRPTLQESYSKHQVYRGTLPKVVFTRSRRRVAIDVASSLLDGSTWNQNRGLSLSLLESAAREAVEALSLLRMRISAKDEFDLDAFLAHASQFTEAFPRTEGELSTFSERRKADRAARLSAKSPWDLIDVEWGDFHGNARSLLNDPFFWDPTNDFSPHGNDTGADLLTDYLKWNRKFPERDASDFFPGLLRRWQISEDTQDSMLRPVVDQAMVALAFAEIKVLGQCAAGVKAKAVDAIRRMEARALAAEWRHKEECLAGLRKSLAALSRIF